MRSLKIIKVKHSTWQEGVRLKNYSESKKYAIFHHNPDSKDGNE